MMSTTSEAIIRAFQKLFSTHGLPHLLVSDNGLQLTSTMFEMFLAGLEILHALISPFHLASNGLTERMVHSSKESLTKMEPRSRQE